MIGGIEETSASFEARSAPRSHPTGGISRGRRSNSTGGLRRRKPAAPIGLRRAGAVSRRARAAAASACGPSAVASCSSAPTATTRRASRRAHSWRKPGSRSRSGSGRCSRSRRGATASRPRSCSGSWASAPTRRRGAGCTSSGRRWCVQTGSRSALVWGVESQVLSSVHDHLFFVPVSLLDPRPFLRPTHNYPRLSRAGVVEVGRRSGLAPRATMTRPHLDNSEHDGTLARSG